MKNDLLFHPEQLDYHGRVSLPALKGIQLPESLVSDEVVTRHRLYLSHEFRRYVLPAMEQVSEVGAVECNKWRPSRSSWTHSELLPGFFLAAPIHWCHVRDMLFSDGGEWKSIIPPNRFGILLPMEGRNEHGQHVVCPVLIRYMAIAERIPNWNVDLVNFDRMGNNVVPPARILLTPVF